MSETAKLFLVLQCAVILGALVRLSFVLASDFPLYDGGLFYSMVHDIEKANFALPSHTSYNSDGLPLAYPPLAFYVAAFLHKVVGLDLLAIFQFMPLIANVLAILAFGLLARSMLSSRTAFTVAVITFALLPEGFRFFITGGGLTRSVGLLFAILAFWAAHELCLTKRWRFVPLLTLFEAGAVLSHPEMALFTAYSLLLIVACFGRDRVTLARFLVSGALAIALALPWLLTVVTSQGIGPFLDATARGGSGGIDIGSILFFRVTGEPAFPFLAVLALIGILVCLATKRYFLPLWLVMIFLLQSRDPRQEDIVAIALLAGIGVAEGLLPLLRSAVEKMPSLEIGQKQMLAPIALGLMFASVGLSDVVFYRPLLTGLSAQEREAMAWIKTGTDAESRFLVITGTRGGDRSFEWFPALTDRVNAAPIEGYEWVPGFKQRVKQDGELQACATQGLDCLSDWTEKVGGTYGYIYMPKQSVAPLFAAGIDRTQKDCCVSLRHALGNSPDYELIYDGDGASIFKLREGIAREAP